MRSAKSRDGTTRLQGTIDPETWEPSDRIMMIRSVFERNRRRFAQGKRVKTSIWSFRTEAPEIRKLA
jgi:hypothetical protein